VRKSLQTAISNYAGEDIAIAMRSFQELIADTLAGRKGAAIAWRSCFSAKCRSASTSHDWCVGVHPKTADLPIIGRSEVLADDQDQAVVGAKGRIDGALSLLACSI